MPLKDTNCRNAKPQDKPYRLYDEQGLYLEVQPNGGRYWRLKYRFLGKEKRLALGVYPAVGLQEARRKRDDARAQLAGGHDPSLQRRMARAVSQLDHQHTFESVAKQWLAIRESSWDPEYTRTVRQRLELNAYPWLGKLPISSISTPMLVENLQRVIKRGARETARRVAQIYKQIFEFAEAAGITPPNQIGNARYLEERIGELIATRPQVRHLVLMCPGVNLIDASALDSLEAIAERLPSAGVQLHLSEVKGPVMDQLKRSDFLQRFGGQVFVSQYEALRALDPESVAQAAGHSA